VADLSAQRFRSRSIGSGQLKRLAARICRDKQLVQPDARLAVEHRHRAAFLRPVKLPLEHPVVKVLDPGAHVVDRLKLVSSLAVHLGQRALLPRIKEHREGSRVSQPLAAVWRQVVAPD